MSELEERITALENIMKAYKMHDPNCPQTWKCDQVGCAVYHILSPCNCWLSE